MMNDAKFLSSLDTLPFKRSCKRLRASSYDRSGGNDDFLVIKSGQKQDIALLQGPGVITHIWFTVGNLGPKIEPFNVRKIALRIWWDDEEDPSVQAPIGDFFGMGHGETRNFVSAPLQMSPQNGKGMNCFFPMPFYKSARMEIENNCDADAVLYFYIDYEKHASLPEGLLYFHAQWNRQCPTQGIKDEGISNKEFMQGGKNTTGEGNYVILDAEGAGHYVGCNINIHNLRESSAFDWPGEGDDMIFIDGEAWPPSLHGTGTEDYVNTAWCPNQEYSAPYHGIILGGEKNWKGRITYYRYHIADPVTFESSVRVTIEHGHNNNRSDDYSSTAYWYQSEPHKPMPPLPSVKERMPLP